MPLQTISVIGLGYIGLPTATVFAAEGFQVSGFDKNTKVIRALKTGQIHIKEPDLQGLYKTVFENGALRISDELEKADIYIVCVPTPFQRQQSKKTADLSYVIEAAKMIAAIIERGNIVILESTVPPRTTEEVFGRTIEESSGLRKGSDFYLAHCPERVLPGKILYELKNNHRIIGATDELSAEKVKRLYASIVKGGEIYTTNTTTAEMCKLVENAFRDIGIAFANELSILCDELEIDVWDLIRLANKHPRVSILSPGAGVGGHCIAVDPWFIIEAFPKNSLLIRQAREVNDQKPLRIVEKVEKELKKKFPGREKQVLFGILGLAYKPDIDDLRESPAIEIANQLVERGYRVVACEPNRSTPEIQGIKNLSLQEILDQADSVITTMGHQEFKNEKESIKKKELFEIVRL